jgi:hypothetical protein
VRSLVTVGSQPLTGSAPVQFVSILCQRCVSSCSVIRVVCCCRVSAVLHVVCIPLDLLNSATQCGETCMCVLVAWRRPTVLSPLNVITAS